MIRFSSKWLLLSIVTFAVTLGCGESKKSLHEMDHVTPAHWPSDLTDAANKLSERVKAVQSGASAAKQIRASHSRNCRTSLDGFRRWLPTRISRKVTG